MERHTYAIFPNLKTPPPVAVQGEGVWIEDSRGRRYLDGSSGALVANLGHGVPELAAALAGQARQLAFVYRTQFASEPLLQLAERVAAWAPGDLSYSFFVNSGSEANEVAIKLAQQYWAEQGKPMKRWFISRWTSYHGSTLGALSLTGNVGRRRAMQGMLEPFPTVMPPHCFFCPAEKSYPACNLYCARELERAVHRLGPENVAAFVAEPLTGASGAAITPPDGYWQTVREICDRHGILLIADEVMTGFGRTGKRFAMDHWQVVPDMMVVGKGLSAGYTPMAGVIVSERIIQTLRDGSGRFGYGHTMAGNPLGAAAALAALRLMEERDLVNRAARTGQRLRSGLEALAARHPVVGEVRGLGLMQGLELVACRQPPTPFPFAWDATGTLIRAAMDQGLILYPGRGALDGAAGDAVLIAPPLTITNAELDELLARLDQALTQFAKELPVNA